MSAKSLEEIVGAKSLADFVLEQGVSNGISYVKWKSGKVEYYGSESISANTSVSGNIILQFPFAYSTVPIVLANWVGSQIAGNPINSIGAGGMEIQHVSEDAHILHWHSIGTIVQ